MTRTRVTEIDGPAALGARLHELRSARGLSLRQLGFPGCTPSYLSTIEHGRRVPSLQILSVLAQKLGVSVSYLATGRESSETEDGLNEAEMLLRLGQVPEAAAAFARFAGSERDRDRARALAGLGICATREGQLAEGLDLLEQARQIDEAAFLSMPAPVNALGRAYSDRSEYESATALFCAAITAARERGDRPGALRMSVLLANTYIDLGDTLHSNDALASALREATELRDPRARANVLWTQARLHTVEGRHDLAADLARKALDVLEVTEDELAIALAEQTLAYIELERGNPAAAAALLDAAEPTIERFAETRERAAFQLERARVLLALDQEAEARALLSRIRPSFFDGKGADAGRYYVSLAELYERLDEPEDSLTMLDAAIDTLSGHRSPHLVRAYRAKGRILQRLGRTDDALLALSTALDLQDARPASTAAS